MSSAVVDKVQNGNIRQMMYTPNVKLWQKLYFPIIQKQTLIIIYNEIIGVWRWRWRLDFSTYLLLIY